MKIGVRETPEMLSRALEIYSYIPETGVILRRRSFQRWKAGDVAGSRTKSGYLEISIGKTKFLAHRLAWALHYGQWPEKQIDHRDCNGLNNKIDNLRLATSQQNQANTRSRGTSRTGLKGVSFHKHSGLYAARISRNGRTVSLGYYESPELAHTAFIRAAEQIDGEFARAA